MERRQGIQHFLDRTSAKYNTPEIRNISFNTEDRGNENTNAKQYSMCYNKNIPELEKYCGVDWVFYHWPSASIRSFETTRDEIIAASSQPPTIDKVGWFGNIYSPLRDVPEYKTRPLLKQIGDANPHLFDIQHISPHHGVIDSRIPNYTSLTDLIKYSSLIDIGGNGYSGRLKFLLYSKRPLLLVDRNYIEFFHNDLQPYVHYIPVRMDLSDLLDQVTWMKNNPQQCRDIAQHAFEYATAHFTEDRLLDRVYSVYQALLK